jgi:hypothetical protein
MGKENSVRPEHESQPELTPVEKFLSQDELNSVKWAAVEETAEKIRLDNELLATEYGKPYDRYIALKEGVNSFEKTWNNFKINKGRTKPQYVNDCAYFEQEIFPIYTSREAERVKKENLHLNETVFLSVVDFRAATAVKDDLSALIQKRRRERNK